MLYYLHYLAQPRHWTFVFNMFKYVTFRAAGAGVTAFLIAVFFGPAVIRYLRRQRLEDDGRKADQPELDARHRQKGATPTMGGLLILTAAGGAALLWTDVIGNLYAWLGLVILFAFGLLGKLDDETKLRRRTGRGITIRQKLIGQVLLSLGVALALYYMAPEPTRPEKDGKEPAAAAVAATPAAMPVAAAPTPVAGAAVADEAGRARREPQGRGVLAVPFRKPVLPLPMVLFVLLAVLVMVGTCNAVNLADGLDGLAIGCTVPVAFAYAILAYISGNFFFADYLHLLYVPGVEELVILCSALGGAALGFLWFNSHPAEVFMGDTGSLPLGAIIGYVALAAKQELLLVIIGGIFVAEGGSVLLQVLSFRLFGRRIFRCAPLHHHFELGGWAENKVVTRFWIISIILAIFGLCTLKIR